ncbi:hypothetical protein NDA01_25865 [Trichocoleus desertorum AS-A10]|uniref:hypothetical protein n=1 Tax=Trichocoleus desertorum TaxID=1481672 RepID=UPI0032997BF3
MLEELLNGLLILEKFDEPPEEVARHFADWLSRVAVALEVAQMTSELAMWNQAISGMRINPDESSFLTQMHSMKAILLGLLSGGRPTNGLFPIEIVEAAVENRRPYIKDITLQVNDCYEAGCYDACLVMLRKLIESLIIECFEKNSLAEEIRDGNGHYYHLRNLIPRFTSKNKTTWNLSRNLEQSLPTLKDVGDLSAHSRYYRAKQNDVDRFQNNIRYAIQELVDIAFVR